MKTQNLISQIAEAVITPSAWSASWNPRTRVEVNPSCNLNWIEQGQVCQATYTDELGTVKLHIKKETQIPASDIHCYCVSYQYRCPHGNLIAQGTWEPRQTINQAKQLAEFQLRQFL
ncbi:MAG: hypothetical protein AAFO04_15540 [Cyanobacteria bacterium J06592_8]